MVQEAAALMNELWQQNGLLQVSYLVAVVQVLVLLQVHLECVWVQYMTITVVPPWR
jgi:hypothetical protein